MITALEQISARYEGFLIDQWGVLHNGREIYPPAVAALQALKAGGKQVVILSNSGRPGLENTKLMAAMGIPETAYDFVLSAGDDAYEALGTPRDAAYRGLGDKVFLFARESDRPPLFDAGYQRVATVAEADFLFLLSMEVAEETPKAWEEILTQALARDLPLICANPDLERVDGEGRVLIAPGAIAKAYAARGGRSYYHGKPHARIYQSAMRRLRLPPERILAIGDSLLHDVAGAGAQGIDSLFVMNGVHRERLGAGDDAALCQEIARHPPHHPRWIIRALR